MSHLFKTCHLTRFRLIQTLNQLGVITLESLQFRYTILYVNDVSDTLNFYEAAFGLKTSMLHEGGDYGELDTGATKLSFSSLKLMTELGKNPAKANSSAPCFEIAFETDDVASALAKALSAGASLVQGAEDMPWGQTIAYVTDNNGFLVELCTAVTPQP